MALPPPCVGVCASLASANDISVRERKKERVSVLILRLRVNETWAASVCVCDKNSLTCLQGLVQEGPVRVNLPIWLFQNFESAQYEKTWPTTAQQDKKQCS